MKEIETFLEKCSKFKGLYHDGLECQIMVAQDKGVKKGNGFTDGINFWHHLRITRPGVRLRYSLSDHAEAIGLSGWNYVTKKSEYIGFDIDSVVGHKCGLTDSEIKEIVEKAKQIPWIEIRRSTSGNGLHFYVFLDFNEEVSTRKEHQLLAKSVLKTMSGLLGMDVKEKVDKCGGILWVWHRKGTSAQSFELVKPAIEKFSSIPKEWKTECKEFRGTILPLTQSIKLLTLNSDQQKLLEWFAKQKTTWWWDSDLNMLVCHTFDLAKAHKELNFKGVFFTNAVGKNVPNDQNCFAFPIKNGSWIIRRHSQGCKEHQYWQTDSAGWTYCYYNKTPTVQDLVELFNGQENEKKEFIFQSKEDVREMLRILSPHTTFEFPIWIGESRKFIVRLLKNSKISVKFERNSDDPLAQGWIANRNNFERVFNVIEEEPEIITPDNIVRHVVANYKDSGWYINSKSWIQEPKQNISSALVTLGYKGDMIENIIGQCILNPWELVNQPFDPEYPGDRKWNKYSPQLLYDPKEGDWSKWDLILTHIGKNLLNAIKKNSWCLANEILTGEQYLKYWVASIFQYPLEPLPYLFLYGPQLSGKSSFHEVISLLVNKGVVRADVSLTNPSRFNGELAGSILCVVEETNLRESKQAYNRIKDWVTSKTISIHEKGKTPFELVNSCHWVQCANNPSFCPIDFGDTRIIMCEVEVPEILIPKEQLFRELREQAPAFIFEIMNCKIPLSSERLRIPVLDTEDKMDSQIASSNLVERFIIEQCYIVKGHTISLSDFALHFRNWLEKNGIPAFEWTNVKISRSIPTSANMPVKGRCGAEGQICLGNISLIEDSKDYEYSYVKDGERIIKR